MKLTIYVEGDTNLAVTAEDLQTLLGTMLPYFIDNVSIEVDVNEGHPWVILDADGEIMDRYETMRDAVENLPADLVSIVYSNQPDLSE